MGFSTRCTSADRRVVVLEVLEQVEGDDEIQRVVRERQAGRVAAERGESAVVSHLGAVGAVLERDGVPAVLAQDTGVATARGADVDGPAGLSPEIALARR